MAPSPAIPPVHPQPVAAETSASLIRRVVRETLKFSVLETIGQGLLWVSYIVLARVLSPRDFGIFDICTFFIAMGTMFGDAGLGAALLRKPEEPSDDEYSSVFVANLLVGALLAVSLVALAPFLTARYQLERQATWVLIALAPTYFLSSLRAYPLIRLERELRFATIARIDLTVLFLRLILAIALALLHFGVWALVAANIAATVLGVVLTLAVRRGLPRLRFVASAFSPLLSFGVQVQLLTIFAFFKDNLSNALLGAMAGPEKVGFFNFGLHYIAVPVIAVNAMARIQLPTYARLQRDLPALHGAVLGALRIAFLVGVPFLVVLSTGSTWLVPLVYGSKWWPALPVAWGLTLNMVGGFAASPLFTLMQARGEAGLALRTFFLWTLTTWVLSLLAWRLGFGLAGIAASYSLVTIIVTFTLLVRAQGLLERSLLRPLLPPVLAGVLAVAVHVALRNAIPNHLVGKHPAFLLSIPLAVFFAVELSLEGPRVFSELRALIRAAQHPAEPSEA